jgi:predicted transcriptional regulator
VQEGQCKRVTNSTTPFTRTSTSPEQQAKLARLAQERGTDAQALVCEAIERLLDYDDWFVREVEKGLGISLTMAG